MLAAIRVRGEVHTTPDVRLTLEILRLHRVNHLVFVPENESMKGMLKTVKDYITFGEVEAELLAGLLQKRGRLVGNKKLDVTFLAKHKMKDYAEFAKQLLNGKKPEDFGVKGVFRLRPPRKGYRGIKRSFVEGGALGYRGKDINELIKRMM